MKRLFNEFLALNEEGREFTTGVRIIAEDLVKIARDNDLDLRDAQLVAAHEVDISFTEAILRRAVEKKKGGSR